MSSIVKFQAISGAMDESPPCYMLQVDEFRFLLDCGWNEKLDDGIIEEIKKYVPQIDAVLLSFPDISHLGALPYLVGKCELNCPIYATIPVYKMGQMFMYDLHQSKHNNEEFNKFSLDDVDNAFDKIIQMRYNQTIRVKTGLSLTPICSGHMLGGTVWKISKGEDDIVYAIDFNHKKERHLNGCEFTISRPSLFITGAYSGVFQQERRRARDEKLVENILKTINNNGCILIAADTAGRVLELAHMLDQLWRTKTHNLSTHQLCLLSNVSYNVIEFAKSQIEWMSEKLVKCFETSRDNPFHFKHLNICHSLKDLKKFKSVVVLASMPDLDSGFSRELFIKYAPQAENSIVLTTRTGLGTLARDLAENGNNRLIPLTIKERIPIHGSELQAYLNSIKTKKKDDDEDELEIISMTKGTKDLVVKTGKKRAYPMFPVKDIRLKFDDYGEIINIPDYKSEKSIKPSKVIKKSQEVMPEAPTRCISYEKNVSLKARVEYIDFEGRSDGLSVRNLIESLNPRKVIIVHGTPENTNSLAQYIKQRTEAEIHTPQKGEIVDTTSEIDLYQIRLTHGLASKLRFQKVKKIELTWINGKILKGQDKEDFNILEPMKLADAEPHDFIFVNELRLSDLKAQMIKKGIDCSFSNGKLWCCNKTISISRDTNNHNKVEVNGLLSVNYYRVRAILYDQYAIL